jgi:hypothetical protein
MAVNRYINNYPSQERINNEYLLMEDVVVESIQMMGHNVYYIPRESFDEGDMILGEYSKSAFNKAYLIESYLVNVTGHEGQNDLFSKFGLEIRDTDTFVISRRAFRRLLPGVIRQRPQEGDLVYVPVLHKMFEIKFVEQEAMFHSIGKKLPFVYELRCEAFRSSQEAINTGVEEIDQVGIDNNYSVSFDLSRTGNSIDYYVGETVFQSSNGNWNGAYAHAMVKEWHPSSNTILVYNIVGEFRDNANLIGNTSHSIYVLENYDNKEDNTYYDMFDNKQLNTDAGVILDLSETNPFGAP